MSISGCVHGETLPSDPLRPINARKHHPAPTSAFNVDGSGPPRSCSYQTPSRINATARRCAGDNSRRPGFRAQNVTYGQTYDSYGTVISRITASLQSLFTDDAPTRRAATPAAAPPGR